MKLSVIAALLLLCGCATKDGRCYPVVGLGWVTIRTNQPTVVTTKSLGFNAGNGQMCVGLSSFMTVTVPTNANVLIELKK